MKAQITKHEISEEFSERGGASVTLVNKETVDLDTSVDEAKDSLCVVGDKLLVKGMFTGLFKSMVAGISRDGNPRQLGDFLTLYAVPRGEFDLEKGWDPAVNSVRFRARLMNELTIDTKDWEFEDVTPGRKSFTIESVGTDGVAGILEMGKTVEINGKNLPATGDLRVDWTVEGTALSGSVAASKLTGSATRVDIAGSAFDEIKSAANDGKKIVLTVRGNYCNASAKATLKYVPPAAPTLTSEYATLFGPTEGNGEMLGGEETNVTIGTNLANATKLVFHYYDGEEENNDEMIIVSKTETQIIFKLPESVLAGINGHLIVTTPNGTYTSEFVCQKLEG